MHLRTLITARRRRLTTVAMAVTLAAGVTLVGSPASATYVKPARSHVIVHGDSGVLDPDVARTSGRWDFGGVGVATGTTVADLGCHATDRVYITITPASADGSIEQPEVAIDGSSAEQDVFPWVLATGSPATGMAAPGDMTPQEVVTTPHGASANFAVSSRDRLFTKAEWNAAPWGTSGGGVEVRAAGATNGTGRAGWGADMSLVLFCSPGTYDDDTGTVRVSSDETGHAITSWFHFHPVAMTDGAATVWPSAGWEYYADAPAPTVATEASSVSRSSATLAATLTDAGGTTYEDATGTIQWYSGDAATSGHEQGAPVAVAAGVATPKSVDLSGFPAGSTQDFLAVYTPDAAAEGHYSGATSEVLTLRVGPDATATTTTLAVTGGLEAGRTQTLTATVAPAAPGTVTFTDGASTLGTSTVSSGVATLQRALTAGAHSIKASFAPADSTQFGASASTAQSVAITKPAATVTISAPGATYGRPASVTVSVTAAGAPVAGQVAVTLDGSPLATPALTARGTATLTLPATTAAGRHVLAASYAASASVGAGNGQQTLTIAKAASVTKIKVVPAKVTAKAAKKGKVKAVVTVAATGVHPSGTVTVQVGAKKVPAKLTAAGTATVKLPKSAAKKLKVTATYAGDTNVAGSTKSITVKVRR